MKSATDFVITYMITDRIELHSVLFPLLIVIACEQAPSKGGKKFGERASESQSVVHDSASEASGTRTPSSPDRSRLIPFDLDCAQLSPTGACSQAIIVTVATDDCLISVHVTWKKNVK